MNEKNDASEEYKHTRRTRSKFVWSHNKRFVSNKWSVDWKARISTRLCESAGSLLVQLLHSARIIRSVFDIPRRVMTRTSESVRSTWIVSFVQIDPRLRKTETSVEPRLKEPIKSLYKEERCLPNLLQFAKMMKNDVFWMKMVDRKTTRWSNWRWRWKVRVKNGSRTLKSFCSQRITKLKRVKFKQKRTIERTFFGLGLGLGFVIAKTDKEEKKRKDARGGVGGCGPERIRKSKI